MANLFYTRFLKGMRTVEKDKLTLTFVTSIINKTFSSKNVKNLNLYKNGGFHFRLSISTFILLDRLKKIFSRVLRLFPHFAQIFAICAIATCFR